MSDSISLDSLPLEELRVLIRNHPGDWRVNTGSEAGLPEPEHQLPVPSGARIFDLPHPDSDPELGNMPLREALAQRRSRREFASDPLSLEHFAFLLWAAQGVTGAYRDENGTILRYLRAAPSGGARYPLETFAGVRNVEGLEPGLYRYLPEGHRLAMLRADEEIGYRMRRACYDAPMAGAASAMVVWAAVPERSEWKYGCISHKMIAIEAGHACQNLHLAAESLMLGVCPILAYHQPAVDEIIEADPERFFAIYLAAIGT
jgi:SagB-type dehydrogenase family enzyme